MNQKHLKVKDVVFKSMVIEKNNFKSILITGSNGYLGSHITQILLAKNYKVRGTIRDIKKAERY